MIPAAVEAIKQETEKKMRLFDSVGHANPNAGVQNLDYAKVAALVAEVLKQMK